MAINRLADGARLAEEIGFDGLTFSEVRQDLEHHGRHDLGRALRALIARGRWDDLASLIDDALLDEFCIAAPYADLAARVSERLGGLVDRVNFVLPEDAQQDRARLSAAVGALQRIPTARERRTGRIRGRSMFS